MSGGFSNKPKILRGAFVAHSPNIPALVVVFQFNPEQLTRQHNLTFSFNDPNVLTPTTTAEPNLRDRSRTTTSPPLVPRSLLDFHRQQELTNIQAGQQVDIQEEAINFELRLDATDQLNLGDKNAGQWGIAPQLATLELMLRPVGEVLAQQLTEQGRYSSNRDNNPPLIVFVWGRQRVLPVNINSINITETEFNTQLEPIRATVAVNLTVIEGKNAVYTQWRSRREAQWGFNPSTRSQIDVVIPG